MMFPRSIHRSNDVHIPGAAQTADTTDAGHAMLRVAHFSPDTPGVDVYLDGQRAVGNMGFKTVTDYLAVPGGEHQLALRPSGASPTSKPVLTGTATLDDGKAYTVAGLGPRAQLHVGVFVDDLQPPPTGMSSVRFVHAVVGAPPVTVDGGSGGPLFKSATFGKATAYESVKPGNYDVSLEDGSGKVLLAPNSVQFGTGITYTVVAIGGGDQPVRILPVVDERSAAAAPSGGLATGGGGTAIRPRSHSSSTTFFTLVGAGLLLTAALMRRRARLV
jgi:Domain of unknown function (DUF4397)